MIQNFIIVAKDQKGNENMPARSLQAKNGSETLYIGVGWIKKNEAGQTFLSCQMSKERTTDANKTYDGYLIISEKEYKRLKNCEARCEFLTSPDENGKSIDMAKHPLTSPKEQSEIDKNLEDIGF